MSKIKCVIQDGPKDCGVCCLLMIIRYYGGNISKEQLRETTNTTTTGTDFYHLLEAAYKIGFQGRGIKGDIAKLDPCLLPCIAHIIVDSKYQHFVVIEEINSKRNVLTIVDPAQGRRKLTFSEFTKLSTNQYLYLRPSRQLVTDTPRKIIQMLLRTFIQQHKKAIVWITIFSCLYTVISMIVVFHFKFLTDYVFPFASISNAKNISIFVSLLILLQLLAYYVRQNILRILEFNLGYFLMDTIIEQIISLPYPYYKNRTTGEILNRINDIEQLKEFLLQLLGFLFVDFLFVIVMSIVLFQINVTLTCYLLGLIFIITGLSNISRRLLKKSWKTIHHTSAKLHTSLVEYLGGVETIKGMHIEKYCSDQLKEQYRQYLNSVSEAKYRLHKWENLKEHCLKLDLVFLLWKGSHFVVKQKLSLSNLIAFYQFYGYFLQSIQNILSFLFSCSSMQLVIHRLEDLFEVEKESFPIILNRIKECVVGDIWFDHLSYSYPHGKRLLSDISFHIQPGEKVVLYGDSGSGKSTLVKLLFRLFPFQEGRILLDGLDVRYYTLNDIRTHITYVSQNETLFANTIYQNIVLDQNVDYNSFLKICHITKVDEMIKDPAIGYDTLIEENGFDLSGGERQRIILARAILKNSAIYIFDESLNQLDIMKEREILRETFSYLKDKTVLVISHRYHNQDLFHRRIKIEKGIVKENVELVSR